MDAGGVGLPDVLHVLQMSMEKYEVRLDVFERAIQEVKSGEDADHSIDGMASSCAVGKQSNPTCKEAACVDYVASGDPEEELSVEAADECLSDARLKEEQGGLEVELGMDDQVLSPGNLLDCPREEIESTDAKDKKRQRHVLCLGKCEWRVAVVDDEIGREGECLVDEDECRVRDVGVSSDLVTAVDARGVPECKAKQVSCNGLQGLPDQIHEEQNQISLATCALKVIQQDNFEHEKEWTAFYAKQVICWAVVEYPEAAVWWIKIISLCL